MDNQAAESRPARHPGVVIGEETETSEWFLVKRRKALKIDAIGKEIWELCDGSRSIAEIADVLGTRYSGTADHISRDVDRFVRSLDVFGFVRWRT